MRNHNKLQATRPIIQSSFRSLIREQLENKGIIKFVDKGFDGDYNGSADKFSHISTDYNEKWILKNDNSVGICLRSCANKGKLAHYMVIACCRILSNNNRRYFALVEHGNEEEWIEVHGLSAGLFDEIDTDKHGTNVIWA